MTWSSSIGTSTVKSYFADFMIIVLRPSPWSQKRDPEKDPWNAEFFISIKFLGCLFVCARMGTPPSVMINIQIVLSRFFFRKFFRCHFWDGCFTLFSNVSTLHKLWKVEWERERERERKGEREMMKRSDIFSWFSFSCFFRCLSLLVGDTQLNYNVAN